MTETRTHKIETPAGVVRTRTARRFIVVRYRDRETFVAYVGAIRICGGYERAEVETRAAAEMARRGIEGDVEITVGRPFAEVVTRTDSFAKARKVAGGAGGEVARFVFDTETGAAA